MAESILSPDIDVASGLGRVRPIKRSDYEALISAGAFINEKVELILGRIVDMSPIGQPHASSVRKLVQHFMKVLEGRAIVFPQSTFALSDDTLLEPDVSVLPLKAGDYETERPTHAHLLIEVADSSLARDTKVKAELYARHGVPEYWVVDLNSQVVRVHRAPAHGRYTSISEHGRGESLAPEAFADAALRIDDILPR